MVTACDDFPRCRYYSFLLRAPREPLPPGPFPGASVDVRTIDEMQQAGSLTVRGAGQVVRQARRAPGKLT